MNKNQILLSVLGLTTAGVVTFGASQASAHFWGGDTNFSSNLASKLGISEDKVKNALSSLRSERQTEMQASLEKRLDQLVADKKISESQKKLILEKHKEIQQNRDSWIDMTPEQRKTAASKAKEELKTWADKNNIDLDNFFGLGMGIKMRHMGRGMW